MSGTDFKMFELVVVKETGVGGRIMDMNIIKGEYLVLSHKLGEWEGNKKWLTINEIERIVDYGT